MKPDERDLLVAVAEKVDPRSHLFPRDVARGMGMHAKRAYYLFDKWTQKGWYNWGVNPGSGWLTDEGRAVAASLNPPSSPA